MLETGKKIKYDYSLLLVLFYTGLPLSVNFYSKKNKISTQKIYISLK